MHRYLYAYSNPTVYIDLFGYRSEKTAKEKAEIAEMRDVASRHKAAYEKKGILGKLYDHTIGVLRGDSDYQKWKVMESHISKREEAIAEAADGEPVIVVSGYAQYQLDVTLSNGKDVKIYQYPDYLTASQAQFLKQLMTLTVAESSFTPSVLYGFTDNHRVIQAASAFDGIWLSFGAAALHRGTNPGLNFVIENLQEPLALKYNPITGKFEYTPPETWFMEDSAVIPYNGQIPTLRLTPPRAILPAPGIGTPVGMGITSKGTVWDDLVNFRKEIGFPTAYTGDRSIDQVTAALDIGGHRFKGYNGWMSNTGTKLDDVMNYLRNDLGMKINRKTPTHAEGKVFYDALKQGIHSKNADLYVDAPFCTSCGANFFQIRPLAKALGIEELKVHIRYSNGNVIEGLYHLNK